MATLTFDVALFRTQFPEFSDAVNYPDSMLQMYWDIATCYISDSDYGALSGSCRQFAINCMTAHLTKLGTNTEDNEALNFVTSATIDKISVSVAQPPNRNQWSWWLSLTPYGQQLQALLSVNAVGGMYLFGS